MSESAVLIVAVNRDAALPAMMDSFCHELCATLQQKTGVKLASDTPLAFENIGSFRTNAENLVVAVVGDSTALPAALARVKMVIKAAAHIAVEFDKGTAQLTLSDVSLNNIARLICGVAQSMLDSADTETAAQPARRCSRSVRKAAPINQRRVSNAKSAVLNVGNVCVTGSLRIGGAAAGHRGRPNPSS